MAGENTVTIEGARLIFRNFAGKESKFNAEGTRTFGVILPPDIAEAMMRDGWNVKYLNPSEEEKEEGIEIGPAWLPVKVGFGKGKPPKIVMLTETRRETLSEDSVETLDWADIAVDENGNPKVDVIVRPYTWAVRGETGIAAYLKTMFITIEEDDLERKYAEANQNPGEE